MKKQPANMPNFCGLLRKSELYDGTKKATKTFHCVKAEFSICCCVYTCCYTFCPRHYHASNTALLARHIVVVHTLKVHIFWEGHKIFKHSTTLEFDRLKSRTSFEMIIGWRNHDQNQNQKGFAFVEFATKKSIEVTVLIKTQNNQKPKPKSK